MLKKWHRLAALFKQYEGDVQWPVALIDRLIEHRGLRRFCVIVDAVPNGNETRRLVNVQTVDPAEIGVDIFHKACMFSRKASESFYQCHSPR